VQEEVEDRTPVNGRRDTPVDTLPERRVAPPSDGLIIAPGSGDLKRQLVHAIRGLTPERRGIRSVAGAGHCMHCWGQGREDAIRVLEEILR
jgi:hypothetical protein